MKIGVTAREELLLGGQPKGEEEETGEESGTPKGNRCTIIPREAAEKRTGTNNNYYYLNGTPVRLFSAEV